MSQLTEADKNSGIMTLALMRTWRQWVHRRVDQLSVDDLVTVAVRGSLDFTLPRMTGPTGQSPHGEPIVFVPLSLLKKRRVTKFSLRDEGGGSLPVLTRPRSGRIGAAVLWAEADLGRATLQDRFELPEMPKRIEKAIIAIASGSFEEALKTRAWLVEHPDRGDECDACFLWRRALAHNPRFKALSRKLAGSYLLITPMTTDGISRRRVIKLEYETPRPQAELGLAVQGDSSEGMHSLRRLARRVALMASLMPYPVYFRSGVVGRSGCYHQEVAAAPGLQLTAARLSIYGADDSSLQGEPDLVTGKLQRAHLHVSDVEGDAFGVTQLFLRARVNNIVRTAWIASLLTVTLLFAVLLLAVLEPGSVTSVVALLLLPPAVLSAYIARQNEPFVASEVLFGLRLTAGASAAVAFFAAGVAAIGKSCTSTVSTAVPALQNIETTCTTRDGALVGLVLLTALALALAVLHESIRRRTNNPPEHRKLADAPQTYGD